MPIANKKSNKSVFEETQIITAEKNTSHSKYMKHLINPVINPDLKAISPLTEPDIKTSALNISQSSAKKERTEPYAHEPHQEETSISGVNPN